MSRPLTFDDRLCIFSLLTRDNVFLRRHVKLLEEDYFLEEEAKWLARNIKAYFDAYDSAPGFQRLYSLLTNDETVKEAERTLFAGYIEDMENNVDSGGEGYYSDLLQRHARSGYARRILGQAQSLLKEGELDAAEKLVLEIQPPKLTTTNMFFLPEDFARILKMEAEQRNAQLVETGITGLDAVLDGGVVPGTLNVFMAPSGYGKSMLLVAVAAHAWQKGFVVYHYSFENKVIETAARYAANVTSRPWRDIYADTMDFIEQSEKPLEEVTFEWLVAEIPEFATIEKYGAGTLGIERLVGDVTTAKDLYASVEELKQNGRPHPHLLVVDYGDLMVPARWQENNYLSEAQVFMELRDLSERLQTPIWTATQTNREGAKAGRIKSIHVRHAYGKVANSDVIIGFSRPDKEKQADDDFSPIEDEEAWLEIIKVRNGEDRIKPIPVCPDFGVANIITLGTNEVKGKPTSNYSLDDAPVKRKKNKDSV